MCIGTNLLRGDSPDLEVGTAVSTAASQEVGFGFKSGLWASFCGICMFSLPFVLMVASPSFSCVTHWWFIHANIYIHTYIYIHGERERDHLGQVACAAHTDFAITSSSFGGSKHSVLCACLLSSPCTGS